MFLGKYRVEAVIGQGGMGVVCEVMHLQLNQRLAMKMLREDVLVDHDAVERFMREAQAAAKLKSEYVAKVTDVGALENGAPYMVMEYLEGHDLGALIDERGTLQVPWTCDLMMQTAEALSEAHSLGIVHRDIKPTNLFVTWRPDGTALIKVLDFGISKTTLGTDMHLTQTQSLLGTPAYMSPEQMRSARLVDARTDIWSLGSVMYELLEGRKPFEAESFSEMCVKVAVDAPSPMTLTPPELQPVVLRCLAKTPEQRYQTMAEFARDLVPFVADPHQASLLVERMQRMLRRSEGNWEGITTGVGQRAVPNHVRELGSAPVRSPWHGGSEPSGAALRTPLPMNAVPRPTSHERSAPASATSEVFGVPARKNSRVGFWVLAAVLLAAAGVAIAVTVRGGDRAPEKDTATTTETTPTSVTSPPVAPIEPKGAAIATPTPPEAKPEIEPGAEIEIDPSQPVETTTAVVTVPKTGTPKATVPKIGTKKVVTTKTGVGTKSVKAVVKEPPKESPPKETPKSDPNCDVYSHPHGCPK
ncbi:serine/threonine-protein kinase [soil metagenome]